MPEVTAWLSSYTRWIQVIHLSGYWGRVSFAKEPYKTDDILQKRPILLRIQVFHHGTDVCTHSIGHCNTLQHLQHTATHCRTLQSSATYRVKTTITYKQRHACTHPRVSFYWKLIVGIPGMRAFFFHSRWQPMGVPSALTPIGQLHQSAPSPVPGDLGRCPSHQSHVTRT